MNPQVPADLLTGITNALNVLLADSGIQLPNLVGFGVDTEATFNYKRAHGMIMLFTWICLAPIAVLLPRYYRGLFKGKKVSETVIHVGLMVTVVIFSLAAFLLVLGGKGWEWTEAKFPYDLITGALQAVPVDTLALVLNGLNLELGQILLDLKNGDFKCPRLDTSYALRFTHSILGIVTLGFVFLQIILAIVARRFKASPSDPPTVPHKLHKVGGFITNLFAICAMAFGMIIFTNYNWGANGFTNKDFRALYVGAWLIWLTILIFSLETIKRKTAGYGEKLKGDESDRERSLLHLKEHIKYHSFNQTKIVLLIFHVLFSLWVALYLMAVVGSYVQTQIANPIFVCDS